MRKSTFPLEISACAKTPKNEYFGTLMGNPQFLVYSTCGNAQSHVNFHMGKSIFPLVRIYTYFCEFPHAVIHLKLQIRVRGNALFLMWELILNCVSPHTVIHQNLCKSAQRIYTFDSQL